jgi:hypothetical protein
MEVNLIKSKAIEARHIAYWQWIVGILAAIVAAWIIVWIVAVVINIGQPQIDYSEGFNMWNAHLFGKGLWNWDSLSGPPYNSIFYTPVWYLIMSPITNLFGDSLIVGRIANIFTMLSCMFVVYLIVSHITKSKGYGLLGAGFTLMSNMMVGWTMFPRVDLLAILFELLGLYIIIKNEKSRWMWFSIPLFILAFYTKQSTVAGALAACAYLAFKDQKRSLIFTLVLAGLGIGSFLLGNSVTNGGLYNQVFRYQGNTVFNYTATVLNNLAYFIAYLMPVFIIGIWRSWKNKTELSSLFVFIALIINTVMLFHIGGNQNYLFESVFALSIAAGIELKNIIENRREWFVYLFIFSVLELAFLVPNLNMADSGYKARASQAEAIISDATYPVLTENAGIVLAAGKEPYYEPFVFNNMAKLGYFDENIVINDLKQNRIEYVITQYKLPYMESVRFNDQVQRAIIGNYHIVMDASRYQLSFVIYEANNRDLK